MAEECGGGVGVRRSGRLGGLILSGGEGGAAGEGAEGHEAEVWALVGEVEFSVAFGAVGVGRIDVAATTVAEA